MFATKVRKLGFSDCFCNDKKGRSFVSMTQNPVRVHVKNVMTGEEEGVIEFDLDEYGKR